MRLGRTAEKEIVADIRGRWTYLEGPRAGDLCFAQINILPTTMQLRLETVLPIMIGSRWGRSDEEYILAQVGCHQVALIELSSGNRWADAIEVDYISKISSDEWTTIQGSAPDEFVRV